MEKKVARITKIKRTTYVISDVSQEDGIVFDFTKFKDIRKRLGLRLGEKENTCLRCNKNFKDGDRLYMVITDKGNYFVCSDCVKKLRREMNLPDYCKPENQNLNKDI